MHDTAGTSVSDRPKRAHKRPQRYGDYIEEQKNAISSLVPHPRSAFQMPETKQDREIVKERNKTFTEKVFKSFFSQEMDTDCCLRLFSFSNLDIMSVVL